VAEEAKTYQEVPDDQRKKAETFFSRGKTVADTGQYDYAIEMFLQGLNIDPEAVDAHKDLRMISMKRKANGGKPVGMFDKMKLLRSGKDEKANMLNAEKVMSFDPGNTDAMQAMIVAANKGGFWETVMWLGPIFEEANASQGKKAEFQKFIVLRDVYKDLQQWALAVRACQYACQLKPEDMDLGSELKRLSVMETMRKGNYTSNEGFRGSVRDKDLQQKLMDSERDVKSAGFMDRKIADAEAQYMADPNETGKMLKFVEALVSTEQMEHENRAIEILQEWYDKTKQFRFRRNIGQVNMKMWGRMVRAKREELKAAPTNEALKKEFEQLRHDQLEFELKEYEEWAENYPTEMLLRFEQAKRLFLLKRYDEAIPVLQQAANDPKLRTDAYIWLGKAFYEAGFPDEAAQILESAINEYSMRNDDRSKDMFYWRARSLEQIGDGDAALKLYSQLAQWQFNYLDAQGRIKRLREERAKK
jgi:tetratricopeptide (TPR) repeat protein